MFLFATECPKLSSSTWTAAGLSHCLVFSLEDYSIFLCIRILNEVLRTFEWGFEHTGFSPWQVNWWFSCCLTGSFYALLTLQSYIDLTVAKIFFFDGTLKPTTSLKIKMGILEITSEKIVLFGLILENL